jgi:hypothetical protein
MSYSIKQKIRIALALSIIVTAIVVSTSKVHAGIGFQETRQNGFSSATDSSEIGKDAATILGDARSVYICSRTVFVKPEVIESALMKRDDFNHSRLLITKDADAADLVITVRRSNFTTEYPYEVMDQKTRLVVAGGKVNSLFGTAAGKIAKGFMRQILRARSGGSGNPAK